ncbi:MAG TPA: isoprenylcysteine carboxylmethyltransferase family protein [Acidimicrobiales bacterium]|nr:isoprenylcysteine carboxylmethyltransferase family protein [Acidimicrobiales bacterium]
MNVGGPVARRARAPFLHMPVPWVYVLGYLAGAGLQLAVPVRVHDPSGAFAALQVAGGLAVLAGLGLAGWAWAIFDRSGTSKVPGEVSRVLVTAGPYRFTRNPMYLGLALAYLGEAGALLQAWPVAFLALVLAYVNWCVIPIEEERLGAFDNYTEYRSTVRRWL